MNLINLIKIPFLNLSRNLRRTLITSLGISFGICSLVLFDGYFSYMLQGLREQTIRSGLGHMQVFRKGYNEFKSTSPQDYLISGEEAANLEDYFFEDERVEVFSKQTNITGLLSNGKNSLPVIVVGAEAENIQLINSSIFLTEGEFFFEEEKGSVNLGSLLAKSLSAEVGEVLTLLSTTAEGYVNALDVTLTGVIETGIRQIDERIVYGNLEHVNNLYGVDSFTNVIVLLSETEDTQGFKSDFIARFESDGNFEELDWEEMAIFYRQVKSFMNSIFVVLQIIIIAIVVFFITNTMIMNVMERIPEIGTIRTLGETKTGVIGLFQTEAFFIGMFGGAVGILLGFVFSYALNRSGINLPPPPGMVNEIPLGFVLTAGNFVKAYVICCLTAFFAGFYPSIKASNMKIAEALRFN